jgi:hypothetical protein
MLVGCSAQPEGDGFEMSLASDSVTISAVAAAYRPTLFDTIGLGFPKSLAVLGDTIIVVDRDQLISVLNRDFELLARWSRRGEGPGEVSNPAHVSRDGSAWLVADAGNFRLERYDDFGVHLGGTPAPANLEHVASVPGGTVVHGSGGTYADLLLPDGTKRPWGPSMSKRDTARVEQDMTVFDKHFLGRFEDGVVILDGETADLYVLSLDGSVQRQWRLDAELGESLFADTGSREDDAFGVTSVAYRPAFTAMAVDRTGSWLALAPGRTNPLGPGPVFVDLSDGTWYPSTVDISESDWETPRDVISMTLERNLLHVISGPWDGSILTLPVLLPPKG